MVELFRSVVSSEEVDVQESVGEPFETVGQVLRPGAVIVEVRNVAVGLGAPVLPAAEVSDFGCVLSYVVETRFQLFHVLELIALLTCSTEAGAVPLLAEPDYTVAAANRAKVLRCSVVLLAVLLANKIALNVIATIVLTVGYLARAFVLSWPSPTTRL